ncbi:MAG: hypothetical protein D3923_02085 [Candidatus Electrothrix sp. AR3]|nr:hypothetical protein [Candidatus Electrothrix sp. AR3]
MKAIKIIGVAVVGLVLSVGAASGQMGQQMMQQKMGGGGGSLNIDMNTLSTVDQALLQMQQQMIEKNYSSMLLKDQMRGKMMAERTPQNYMQDSIQPVMMVQMRDQIKPQQMQLMQSR